MNNITFEYQYTVEGYLTFSINVVSGKFAGFSNFCISESLLKDAISTLSNMYTKLKGTYQMNDYDSDDFILFEFAELGHLKISGQIGGSHRQQYLTYQYVTDQTVLSDIISNLREMVNHIS